MRVHIMFLRLPKKILIEYLIFYISFEINFKYNFEHYYILPEAPQTTVRQAAAVLAKNTVDEMKSAKQIRHPFQELPVLSEDYGKDNPDIEDSQLLDIAEGDDGEYLPEQMQDGNKLYIISVLQQIINQVI